MPEYRFYRLKKNGSIDGPPPVFDLTNDEAALEKAKQLVDGHDIEIWQGARIVGHLNFKDG